MRLNRDTYESVFIDYLEGNLSDEDLKSLVDFLDQNPDLEEELKELTSFSKNIKNTASDNSSFDSSILIKSPVFDEDISNFDELCISFYEGLLNEKEEEQLLELTENRKDLLATFEAYANTKLKADQTITFPNKASLKKRKKIALHQYISYAASIIIVLGFIFYIQDNNIAEQTNNPIQYSSSGHSYMDYPKVGFLKGQTFAAVENNKTEEPKHKNITNRNVQKQTSQNSETVTIPADSFSNWEDNLTQNEDNSNRLYSRKGKLAYSNLTELELHLAKLFNEKTIDKQSIASELQQAEDVNNEKHIDPVNRYNNTIQLATSIDPIQYQKRILGSQPIK